MQMETSVALYCALLDCFGEQIPGMQRCVGHICILLLGIPKTIPIVRIHWEEQEHDLSELEIKKVTGEIGSYMM